MGTAQMMMCFRDFVENTAFEIGILLKKVWVGSGFLPPVSRRAFSCFTCSKMSRGNALLTPNKNKTSREVHLDCLTKGVTEFLQRDVVDLLVVRKFGVKASYCLRLVVEIPLFTRVFIYTSQVVQDFFQKRFIEIFSDESLEAPLGGRSRHLFCRSRNLFLIPLTVGFASEVPLEQKQPTKNNTCLIGQRPVVIVRHDVLRVSVSVWTHVSVFFVRWNNSWRRTHESRKQTPGDSKWPFDFPVGGHLTP